MLLSLSILIASVSFLCYKHPPLSWPFLQWLLRPSIQDNTTKNEDAPPLPPTDQDLSTPKQEPILVLEEEKSPLIKADGSLQRSKQALDRKAMPPPPLLKKPISNPSPSIISNDTTPTITTFTLANPQDGPEDEDEDYDAMPPPSFPAMNSAQRASNVPRGPPRLNALPTPPTCPPSPSRTAGLMLPPSRSLPLPNRKPAQNTTTTNNLAPPTHSAPPLKPRQKVQLTPGHSALDWARLTSSPTANLRGLPPSTSYLKVPPSLLKIYNGRPSKSLPLLPNGENARMDAWTVLGGKVYNITPYLPYHPGGEAELLRVAGKDGSKLFGEVHPWVNWEGMLEGCLVGVAVGEEEVGMKASLEEMD